MKTAFVLIQLLTLSFAQQKEDIDILLNQIFPKPTDSSGTENRQSEGQGNVPSTTGNINLQPSNVSPVPGTGSCECVPYYLCRNGTINRDGTDVIDIRLQEGACHYLSVCCDVGDKINPDDRVVLPVPDDKPKGCGVRNPNGIGFRITGGKDNEAQFGEFPWMAAVLREEGVTGQTRKLLVYQCGASLLHPKVALTSAHCVRDNSKKYKIRAGEWDTQTQDELMAYQDRDVESVIIHPQYYAGALFNDVAVLILSSPLEITGNVDTICLPPQGMTVENTNCYASGWGKDVFGQEGKYQVILKKVELPIVQRNTCQESLRTTRLGKHFNLHSSFVCAGGEPGKDTCKGDGGSPLVCPLSGKPGKYFQAGIVAWGIGCGENQIPGVYANVAQFSDWIDEQIAANNLEKSYYTN